GHDLRRRRPAHPFQMTEPVRPVERVPPDLALSAAPQPDPPVVPPEVFPTPPEPPHPPELPLDRSLSLFRRRVRKFRRLRRGYYSFLFITTGYALSFFLPLLANNIPLV